MKVSVSLPADDIAFVDRYARDNGLNRSTTMREAITMLRRRNLSADYDAAVDEWVASGEADVWDVTTGDGVR
jgi:Arc/MetJ-type ribon-helix-helix transcriptional regulator